MCKDGSPDFDRGPGAAPSRRAGLWTLDRVTEMRLHHSNRLEVLAVELAHLMHSEPGDPFAPERIVVPHPTIGRWLSLELARELGIAANVRYEQPAEFAWAVMRAVVPGLSADQPFKPARLRWRIHDRLPAPAAGELRKRAERGGSPNAPPDLGATDDDGRGPEGAVRGYLRDGDPRKRLELSDRLARMYDQCLLYRPDWIREWEAGSASHWQGHLWHRMMESDGPDRADHWVNALDRFQRRFRDEFRPDRAHGGSDARCARSPAPPAADRSWVEDSERPPGWPRRASFFAVPALSPSYLELLREAARGIEIHLFVLNPCREYWGDIHSRREIDRRTDGADPDAGYFTEGNELLAAWGRAGRDMIDALVEVPGATWEERFVEPVGAGCLAAVQRDVLDLRLAEDAARDDATRSHAFGENGRDAETAAGSLAEPTPEAMSPPGSFAGAIPEARPSDARASDADASLQIHVCHSPVREAEVLHDRLLAIFDDHPGLEPADVLVLTPDLEAYGPAIEAVFAAAGRIPCRVARVRAADSRTLRAMLDLLSLPPSRHGAEAVLGPLAAPAIGARFGIGDAELATIREWVREAGIRWGVDEAHRGEEDLPETADHTWRHGLRRLVLGYAMAEVAEPVAGLVPCRPGVGTFDLGEVDGELLGRFVSYCEKAFELRARLGGRRRPARWGAVLRDVVRDFLADGSERVPGTGESERWALARELAEESAAVHALIREFENEASDARTAVPLEVVLDVLRERADDTARESARLTDGVTVAGLAAGRIFPAGVVCVVGMNDGVFPRSPSTPSFDLVASGRVRRGDRDIRREDRFAFLEALLSARHAFLVTYAGRGLRDDAPIPPSVVVDELKDYLARRFPGATFETRHPLQPFSPRYFEVVGETGPGDGLFSYSRGMCEAAKIVRTGTAASDPRSRFVGVELPEPDEVGRCVDLADLVTFFANPTRAFLRGRLGVRLELDDLTLEDEEPFELDTLERYRLRADIWDQMRAGVSRERGAALLHGSGRLPQAGLGRIVHEWAREEVEPLEALLSPHRGALQARPRPIDFELGGFRVVGAVEHVDPTTGGMNGAESNANRAGGAELGSMVWWRMGRLRARDRIEVWLRQLAWAAAGHGRLQAAVVSQERGAWRSAMFPPPEDARELLGRWLDAWWHGLATPLHFFPETSFAFAKAIASVPDDGDAIPASTLEAAREKAYVAWLGNPRQPGPAEGSELHRVLAHDADDPLSGDFEALSASLLVPLARSQP